MEVSTRPLDKAASAFLRPFERMIGGFGRYAILMARSFNFPRDLSPGVYTRNLVDQMVRIGVDSIPIVALAAAFTGGVATFQSIYQIERTILPGSLVGVFAQQSILLELATVITAFVLCGRVGARIAAEIGTMRVKDQIDALEAMGVSSLSFLVAPRVVAGTLTFPILYIIASVVALGAGGFVSDLHPALTLEVYLEGTRQYFQPYDVTFGLIKSLVFGFVITSVACFTGYETEGGAAGVGRATTRAAVLGCVFVLLADYLCAALLL